MDYFLLKPFIHKFISDNGKCYIYDVNTNEIIKVNQVIYDLIDDVNLPKAQIFSKWQRKYKKLSIEEVLKIISLSQKHGLFSPRHPEKMAYPACKNCLNNLLTSGVKQLILNISECCNLRCRYCLYSGSYFYERVHSNAIMEDEVAQRAVSFLKQHSNDSQKISFSFYGGEPLTCFPKIKNIVNYIKIISEWPPVTFHLDSNGTLFNREIIHFLIKNKFRLQISLDGPKEIHDRYRVFKNGKGTFNRIIHNLKLIKEIDEEYYEKSVYFSVTLAPPYNFAKMNKFFSKAMFRGKLISLSFIQPFDTQFFEKYSLPPIDYNFRQNINKIKSHYISAKVNDEEPTDVEKQLFERTLITIHTRHRRLMGENCFPNGICVPGVQRLFVNTDGKFYPCERVGTTFQIGDVITGFNRAAIKKVIDEYIKLSQPECVKCWAVRLCKLCFASVRKGNKLDRERKRQYCGIEKMNLHNALVLYATIMEKNQMAFDFVKEMIFEGE